MKGYNFKEKNTIKVSNGENDGFRLVRVDKGVESYVILSQEQFERLEFALQQVFKDDFILGFEKEEKPNTFNN